MLGKEVQKTSFSILTDELPYLIEQQDMLEFMMSAEKSRQSPYFSFSLVPLTRDYDIQRSGDKV